jgi:hypothetical protein
MSVHPPRRLHTMYQRAEWGFDAVSEIVVRPVPTRSAGDGV